MVCVSTYFHAYASHPFRVRVGTSASSISHGLHRRRRRRRQSGLKGKGAMVHVGVASRDIRGSGSVTGSYGVVTLLLVGEKCPFQYGFGGSGTVGGFPFRTVFLFPLLTQCGRSYVVRLGAAVSFNAPQRRLGVARERVREREKEREAKHDVFRKREERRGNTYIHMLIHSAHLFHPVETNVVGSVTEGVHQLNGHEFEADKAVGQKEGELHDGNEVVGADHTDQDEGHGIDPQKQKGPTHLDEGERQGRRRQHERRTVMFRKLTAQVDHPYPFQQLLRRLEGRAAVVEMGPEDVDPLHGIQIVHSDHLTLFVEPALVV